MSVATATESPVSVPPRSVRNGTAFPAEPHKFTVEEYFALEAASEIRYEYDEGILIPMAGTSFEHNEIALNIAFALKNAFKGTGCRAFVEAIRLRVSPTKYRYPDVMALCESPVSDGNKPPALLNPAVIFEVLSDSTEETDKGKKIEEYFQLPSVTDYLLLAQERVHVMHWSKQNGGQWNSNEYTELSASILLESVNITLALAEIYDTIEFTASEATAS